MKRNLACYGARLLALLALVMLAGVAVAQEGGGEPSGTLYTVARGDDAESIAEGFDISLACLVGANEGLDPDELVVGATLLIPDDCAPYEDEGQGGGDAATLPAQTTPPVFANEEYVVKAGDRLARIARAYNTTVACIAQTNRILNPDLIYVGQVLLITADCQSSGGGVSPIGTTTGERRACMFDRYAGRQAVGGQYTVRPGDVLDFIACDFGVSTQCLAAANNLTNAARLVPGQVLFIDLNCPAWDGPPGPGDVRGGN